MELKFYRCAHCGQIVAMIQETGVPLVCCGEKMEELLPGTTDAAHEKHVPLYEIQDGAVLVSVGSVAHPMLDVHYIEWIAVETGSGMQLKRLRPGDEPKCSFALTEGDEVKAVYAYCNLHSLWKA